TDSTGGMGIYGLATAATGTTFGVRGDVLSPSGRGVYGNATAGTGVTYGVLGIAASTSGIGLAGQATAVTGSTIGVRAVNSSPAGTAAIFDALGGGKILSGRTTGFVEKFSVDGSGNVTAGGSVISSGSFSTATGAVSAAGGSYSGTTANQIVSVLQSGIGSGLTATTLSPDAASAAIRGYATNSQYLPTQSAQNGVYGYSAAYLGAGVKGETSGSSGVGVRGEVVSPQNYAIGVQGITISPSNVSSGVEGRATEEANGAHGVRGISSAPVGIGNGVWGSAASVSGAGVYGSNSSATGGSGVSGYAPYGIGVNGNGSTGVKGSGNPGVNGQNGMSGVGVLGEATSTGYYLGTGVKGVAATSQDGSTGVFGDATSLTGANIGVRGRSAGTNGIGVLAEVTGNAFTTYAIKATAQSPFGAVISAVGSNGSAGLYAETDTDITGDFNRTGGFDTDPILQARVGSDIRFKVLGNGNVYADGTFTGGGADFAEAMAVRGERDQYEPGDVLTIDPTGDRQLTLPNQAYSTQVAGIYSTKPGMLGRPYPMDGPRLDQGIPLAVVGIVPCKVSAENGPIARGDLLVTSSTRGHAMKGTDRGRMLGAVVGKALEPLASGTGIIQVLVTLQ
ncbi:MAG: hypothetical protein LAO07_12295, partial [Acidobacteriia bacterium]|nr:hypothetical protein [Terriglobia bacterium]